MRIIRRAEERDYAAMRAIYAYYVENTTVSFETYPPTEDEFSRRMEAIKDKFPVMVCELEGKIVGFTYACSISERDGYSWCTQLSTYVRVEMRHRGIGRSLEGVQSDILRILGYRRIYTLVTSTNEQSISFHMSRGYRVAAIFEEQGYKMGEWLSVTWLEKELGGRETARQKPVDLSTIKDDLLSEIIKKWN